MSIANLMTKVDFHILPTTQEHDVLHYVGRLTQKASKRQHKVLIAAQDADQAERLSSALWATQPQAFLAHTDVSGAPCDIQITSNDSCGEHHDVLINLRPQAPAFFSRFDRVFEVVSQQPDWLKASRERYRYYNDRGYPLKRHDLRDQA